MSGSRVNIERMKPAHFGEVARILATPSVCSAYFDEPVAAALDRIRRIALWSDWQTDGIEYLGASLNDAGGRCVGAAHVCADSVGFFVDPDWHRQGIGGLLLRAACAAGLTHGLHTLKARTLRDNLAARRTLVASGFAVAGIGSRFADYTYSRV